MPVPALASISTKRAGGDLFDSSSKKLKSNSDEEEEFDDEEEEEEFGDDGDDEDFADDSAPGMVSDLEEAKVWWNGDDGIEFVNSRKKSNEDEGMRVDLDDANLIGKLVKRFFGRGVVSYGKVVGWFPPEESGDEILYHVLHGDGDEEDLDPSETKEAAAQVAEEDEDETDKPQEKKRANADLTKPSNVATTRKDSLVSAKSQASEGVDTDRKTMLTKTPKYQQPAANMTEAATRGVMFMFHLSNDEANLMKFGSDVLQSLYDISSVAPEPLRRVALQRVEVVAQRWKAKFSSLTAFAEDQVAGVRPDEVMDAVMGVYSLERVGLENVLESQVGDYLTKTNFLARDYLLFDPYRGSPLLDSSRKADKFSVLTTALITAYFANRVGVTLGDSSASVTLGGVLNHIRYLRPYKLPEDMEQEDWVDQITLIFNVVHVCSNFGELRLRPSLLPLELAFLEDIDNLDHAIKENDVHIIGEICHCLRVFGLTTGSSAVLEKGLAFLLTQQNTQDGSWPTRHGEMDAYVRYHAAMCATMALYEPVFRGFGPGCADLNNLIMKWNRRDKLVAVVGGEESAPAALSVVETAYSGAARASNEAAGEARLDALLRWKAVTAEQSPSGFDPSTSKSVPRRQCAGRSSVASRMRATELSKNGTNELSFAGADLEDTDDETEGIRGFC